MIESLERTQRKLREMIAELESDLGVGPAYPVTIKLLEAMQACEEVGGGRVPLLDGGDR
jgi:hypothetical protein